MKIIYNLIVAALVLCAGCTKEETPEAKAPEKRPPIELPTPSVGAYKKLLEKRESSVGGANINIMQEVSKYQNASDAEKRQLYDQVKALVD